jgi:excisionase family DNA binding protein
MKLESGRGWLHQPRTFVDFVYSSSAWSSGQRRPGFKARYHQRDESSGSSLASALVNYSPDVQLRFCQYSRMAKSMLTTPQVAARLGVTVRRVQALIHAGRLPSQQFGRDHLIKESDLELVGGPQAGKTEQAGCGKATQGKVMPLYFGVQLCSLIFQTLDTNEAL